jgi:hypothetical protein
MEKVRQRESGEIRDLMNEQIERKEELEAILAFVLGLGCQVKYEGMHSNSQFEATKSKIVLSLLSEISSWGYFKSCNNC